MNSAAKPATDSDCVRRLVRKGFKVFPLVTNGKKPALKNGFKDATDEWQKEWNGYNIGCTLPKDCIAIDVDSEEALQHLRESLEGIWSEDTYTVKTPRGYHFVWRAPGINWQWTGNNPSFGKGVDSRVHDKGYLVGPGSTVNGHTYMLLDHNEGRINDMPAALMELCRKGESMAGEVKDTAPSRRQRSGNIIARIAKGQRHSTMLTYVGQLAHYDATEKSVRDIATFLNSENFNPPLPGDEVSRIVSYIVSREGEGNREFVQTGHSQEENIRQALEAIGIRLRYNTRASCIEALIEEKWEPVTDSVQATFISDIQKTCITAPVLKHDNKLADIKPIKFDANVWRTFTLALANRNAVDPFEDWLESLPEWDGEERLSTLISNVFECEDSDPALLKWASRSVLIGCVARTMQPGIKHDEVVVLIGPEGIGKSTLWASLLPETNLFSDSLNMAGSDKERIEALLGKVIVESAELRGSTRADIDALKAFLSRDCDYVRLAYQRYPINLPRRCIIVGTANSINCLPNDPGGNRRFVAVSVNGKDSNADRVRKNISKHRTQLWAEALAAYGNGEQAYLPPELRTAQRSNVEAHRHKNILLEEKIEKFTEGCFEFSMSTLCEKMNMDNPNVGQQKEIASYLRKIGFTRMKKNIRDQKTGTRKKVSVWERAK